MDKYEIQLINSPTDGLNYRVTHVQSDSRVATCYLKEHAELVCDALNAYSGKIFMRREEEAVMDIVRENNIEIYPDIDASELDFPDDDLRDK